MQLFTLTNQALEITVRPERGGRIDQIHDRRNGRDWLWHPPGYDAARDPVPHYGDSFDALWSGGMEEMFPNDGAVRIDGRDLPDHGEWWSAQWQVEECAEQLIRLRYACVSVPVVVEKRIVLDPVSARLSIRWRLHNTSIAVVPFMLKLHPALRLEAGDEVLMPDCDIEPVDPGFSRLVGQPGLTRWPLARDADGAAVRLDRIPGTDSGLREFVYASGLAAGWCGWRHAGSGATLQLRFAQDDFPVVWLFYSCGGFNGHQVAMLEPCTSKPWDLREAIRVGTAARLEAGETRDIEVVLALTPGTT